MSKRWSSGREHLPIFHEDRSLAESVFIASMIAFGVLFTTILTATLVLVYV